MKSSPNAPTYPEVVLVDDQTATQHVGTLLVAALSVLSVVALWFAGKPQLLRVALPAGGTFVALMLYRSNPVSYFRFGLWVWFLTPLARRIVDWRFGFVEPNLVLLAPFLVAGVSLLNLLPSNRRIKTDVPAPFVLCGAAILYGFIIGMLLEPSAESAFGLLNWLCPLLFGLHLCLHWTQYEQYKAAIFNTFLWAVLVLGLYGVYQFLIPPAWDTYWLESVMSTSQSFGLPEALQIRVWSTMNSPGPFATTMMAGLLLLVIMRSPLKLPAAVAGYLSLLLSVVRTAWLSWAVGFLLLLKSARPRLIVRVVLSVVLLVACLLPFANDPRLSVVIGDRIKTFTDLGHDESLGARMDMYRLLVEDVVNHPFGFGLKNVIVSHGMALDSGVLQLIFSLGWLGTSIFAAGIFFLFSGHGSIEKSDEFCAASKAIVIAVLAQIVSGPVFVNVTGAIFWIFVGMYFAAARYGASQPQMDRTGPAAES